LTLILARALEKQPKFGKGESYYNEKRFCVAETLYQTSSLYSSMLVQMTRLFQTEQIELPVDDVDITPLTEKIKVGFL